MITQYQVDIGLGYPLAAPCGCPSNYLDIMSSYMAYMCCGWEGFSCLVPGTDWEIGLKVEQLVLGPGNVQQYQAVNLTGASALFTMKIMESDPVGLTRNSSVDLPNIVPTRRQIGIDDQTVDAGPGGVTGRGWMRLRFARTEQQVLLPFANNGLNQYDLRVKLADEQVFTLLRGRFEVLRAMSKSF